MSAPNDIPDVNVWVALTDTFHVHHQRAHRYWMAESADRLAFCSFTVAGFLRIITNSKAMAGKPFSIPDAWTKYREFADLPEVFFAPDRPGIDARLQPWMSLGFFSSKLWTDAWIAALALENGCRVVSFDADFAKFPGLDFLHLQP